MSNALTLSQEKMMGGGIARILPALLTLLVVLLGAPSAAYAETVEKNVEVDGITYTFEIDTDALTAELYGIENPAASTAVSVPGTVEVDGVTYTVTSMYFSSFGDSLPNITSLELPDTLTSIQGSFRCFSGVSEITIPSSVKVFEASFQNMDSLQTLTFSEGVREIGQSAGSMVSGCEALTTINLPSTLEAINANSCFSNATALTTISLPDGLQFGSSTLGHFSGCTSLTSMTLPKSMTQIPMSMFSGCTSLATVTATSPITKVGSSAFSGCTALTTIPDLGSVTQIDSYAFNECAALPGPVDLSSVTSLGSYAFNECRALEGDVDLSGLTTIPSYAFVYTHVRVTALSPALTSIGTWAFVWADLSDVELPDILTTIGSYACYGADLPDPLEIPDSVTSIGKGAFGSTEVKEFHIGSGITELDASVFPEDVEKVVIDNSADNVRFTGTLPAGAELVYELPSLGEEGDSISEDGPSLQEAVDQAAPDEVIELEKNVELSATLVIPADKDVTIRAAGEDRYLFSLEGSGVRDLVEVEPGSSVTFEGSGDAQLVLLCKDITGSAITSEGSVTLGAGSLVTRAYFGNSSSGIVAARGEKASVTIAGGTISDNKIISNAAYTGSVYVDDGAHFSMSSGSISNNDASAANTLTGSAGVYLADGASGELSGGNISGNKGHRGSAVFLRSEKDGEQGRVTFTQSGGTISDNVCTKAGSVDAGGTVFIESNAEYHLIDGSICDNSVGVGNGGGVAAVDGNLQRGQAEYGTAFVMDGGVVSGNSANYGGGIYSYTNGVELNAGEISGNRAFSTGGGVYSEGNSDYYGTIRVKNALVTGNTAQQGGGLYFCATGSGAISSTDGMAVYGNTAVDGTDMDAAGDDVVFTKGANDNYLLTLDTRLLGGGAVRWVTDGGVYLSSTGLSVHPTTSDAPRYDASSPVDISAEELSSGLKSCYAIKAVVGEGSAAQAEKEAQLLITGNTAVRGGGIGSNGGVVSGADDKTKVSVSKIWDDEGDKDGIRPSSVTVRLFNGENEIDSMTLSADNDWTGVFENLPLGGDYSVAEDVPAGYELSVSGSASEGFVLTNAHVPEEPEEPEGPGGPEEPDGPEEPGGPSEPGNPDEPNGPDDSDDPKEPGGPAEPGDPEEPGTPAGSKDPVIPETGDASCVGVLLASGGGVAALVAGTVLRRRSA